MAVANDFGYLLNLVASRSLGPTHFGALGALLGPILIGNVVALGLQTMTARVIADDAGRAVEQAAPPLYRLAVAAAVLGLVTAAAAPALSALLHLDDRRPAWMLPVVLAALTLI